MLKNSKHRTRSRGLIGLDLQTNEVRVFGSGREAAEYAKEFGRKVKGEIPTIMNNVKRKSYTGEKCYGIIWYNVTADMSDTEVQRKVRTLKSRHLFGQVLDRFFTDTTTMDDESVEFLEGGLNALVDFVELKYEQRVLKDMEEPEEEINPNPEE